MSIDSEWESFVSQMRIENQPSFIASTTTAPIQKLKVKIDNDSKKGILKTAPPCGELIISTKTKKLYLNRTQINVLDIFWKLPIVNYCENTTGIIKKQTKVTCQTPEEVTDYIEKRDCEYYYKEKIIKQIDNPNSKKTKFKDERKITIGMSSKELLNCRMKDKKSAFYNCFALVFRIMDERVNEFREIHVKIFNTGKLEIPGVVDDYLLNIAKDNVLTTLRHYLNGDNNEELNYQDCPDEHVLINSNFNAGFYIDRVALSRILRGPKYKLDTSYDSFYPGVKTLFYFNHKHGYDKEKQHGYIEEEDCHLKLQDLIQSNKYTKITFIVFRTGGCLVLGGCSEEMIRYVYSFVRDILKDEYENIYTEIDEESAEAAILANEKKTREKIRKRKIIVSQPYFMENIICTK